MRRFCRAFGATALLAIVAGALPNSVQAASFEPPVRISPPTGTSAEPVNPEFVDPAASPLPDGGAVVVWQRRAELALAPQIQAAFVDPHGTPGPVIDVNAAGLTPNVLAVGDGAAIVAWEVNGTIATATVSADGTVGPATAIGGGRQQRPTIELIDGRPTVAWITRDRHVAVATLTPGNEVVTSDVMESPRARGYDEVHLTAGPKPQAVWIENESGRGVLDANDAVVRAPISPDGTIGRARDVVRVKSNSEWFFRNTAVDGQHLVVIREGSEGPESLIYAPLQGKKKPSVLAQYRGRDERTTVSIEDADLAASARGEVTVAWSDVRYRPQQYRIRATEISPRGKIRKRVDLASGRERLRAPRVVLDEGGEAVAVWSAARGAESATVGRKPRATTVTGTAGHYVSGKQLVGLSGGGVFLAWEDFGVDRAQTIAGSLGSP